MVRENIIPLENKKPFETVYELKKAFYVIVRDTTDWDWKYPERRGVGGGIYHGWIVKDELGFDLSNDYNKYTNNIICCGGFAWMPDRSPCKQYVSRSLNMVNQVGGNTNGKPELSPEEKKLVDFCWDEYVEHGPSYTIPDTYYSMSF